MSERVLIQGAHYSFHDQAAALLGIPEALREPVETHDALYRELGIRDNGQAVTAFVNTTKGRIGGSYERILAGTARVVGRADLTIELPLYGIPGSVETDITHIHSQSHALDQCRGKLAERFPGVTLVDEHDTAGSALLVRALNDPAHVAITPHPAGRAANLECLVPGMQDREHNVTSFYHLGRGEYSVVPEDATMTVAALRCIGNEYSRHWLEVEVALGRVGLVHESDIDTDALIVEMNSGGDHMAAIHEARMTLEGMYDVVYLGGYAPLVAQAELAPLVVTSVS